MAAPLAHRKDIDGLRAVAILPVLFFHAGIDVFRGGFVGVDVFFVISGYLITALILKERQEGSFSLIRFYERRARRILPALFLVMICCLPFAWAWLLPSDFRDFADSMMAVVLFVSNVHFHREAGYFAPDASLQPLLHTWSLSVEEQFYLLFPLLVTAFWFLGRKALGALILAIAVISLLVAQFGAHAAGLFDADAKALPFTAVPDYAFYLLPTRAWELLAGSLAAFRLQGGERRLEGSEILSLAGLIAILYAVFLFDETTPHPSFHTLLPVGGTVLIILFATPGTFCARLLSMPFLVGIGLISYSVYLWHQPLFAFYRIQSPDGQDDIAFLLLALLSLALGWLSWRFVEQPFRDRQRVSRKQIFGWSASCGVCLFGFGLLGHEFDGFINRFPEKNRQLVATADRKTMGRYVYSRHEQYENLPFAEDGRPKVLIVGDSYAQDLVNMLAENGALDQVSLSVHEIAAPCGNLYLDTDFTHLIAAKHRNRCLGDGWYEGVDVQRRLREADVVFLVSAWIAWVAERLPSSLDNLRDAFDARFVLVGGKSFGKIDLRRYLDWTDDDKRAFRNRVADGHTETNRVLSERFDDETFVDLTLLFCGSHRDCPIFTSDLELVSYDGRHLTREGAAHLGEKLLTHPLIADVLDLDVTRLADRDRHHRQ